MCSTAMLYHYLKIKWVKKNKLCFCIKMRNFVEHIQNNITTKIGGNLGLNGKDVVFLLYNGQSEKRIEDE